jgi:hypothetical protein
MQTNKTHWPSLVVLIVLALSVLFVFLIALALCVSSVINLVSNKGDPAGQMIGAFAYGFEMVALLVCAWFVLQKTMGREQADLPFKFPFAMWQVMAILGLVGISVLVGGIVAYENITWLSWAILPVLTILVIVLPIWLLLGLGSNQIELGSRWRVFGTLGLSLSIGPFVMIMLEVVMLVIVACVGIFVLAVQQPALLQDVTNLENIAELQKNQEAILKLIAPFISNPSVVAIMLGYISLIVPMIEELLKPLGVWIFAKKIDSPVQGFAMGLLGGAAFALIESLNASGDGSASWPFIVSVRMTTGLLHVTTSGLVGWAIVSAFKEKRSMRFFAAYFGAVTLHGVWNACAVGVGLSTIGEFIGKPEWLFNYAPATLCGMIVLAIGLFSMLITANQRLRKISPVPLAAVTENEGVQ